LNIEQSFSIFITYLISISLSRQLSASTTNIMDGTNSEITSTHYITEEASYLPDACLVVCWVFSPNQECF